MKNRRQFLSAAVRGGILASFALLGGVLIRRWHESPDCQRNFACGNCTISTKCTLPEVDAYRLERAKGFMTNVQDERGSK